MGKTLNHLKGVNKLTKEFERLRAKARKKYQIQIDYIKSRVGGREFTVETGLLSFCRTEVGFWCQFKEVPEEFTGALGSEIIYENIGSSESHEFLAKIQSWMKDVSPDNTHVFEVLAFYGLDYSNLDEQFWYQYPYEDQEIAFSAGIIQKQLPLYLKARIDSNLLVPTFGIQSWVLVFIKLHDQHMLIRVPKDYTQDFVHPGSELVH